jgi:hypothetical protein
VDASPHPHQHEKSGALLLFCKWLYFSLQIDQKAGMPI